MPIMPGQYPPPKQTQPTETIFENLSFEPSDPANVSVPADVIVPDDLVALDPAPAAIRVRHGTPSPPPATDPPADPFNLDNYLLTSSDGFSPFDQNLGTAPFHDLHGEEIWAALAYIEDGGVHPGKAAPHLNPPIRVPLGGKEFHLPIYSQYSILLPNPEFMKYISLTDDLELPDGFTPVPAGCEKDGLRKLYFATAMVPRTFFDGLFGNRGDEGMICVPGKWGEHLGGVMVAYGGREITVKDNGEVLCWKK